MRAAAPTAAQLLPVVTEPADPPEASAPTEAPLFTCKALLTGRQLAVLLLLAPLLSLAWGLATDEGSGRSEQRQAERPAARRQAERLPPLSPQVL